MQYKQKNYLYSLLSFFTLWFTQHSYSMIDVCDEVIANTFIQQFPHRTLAETRESYEDCSVGVREKIWITVQSKRGKIEDQFDNKLSNNIFETTLNMATWLSTDDQKNVLSKLLHDNKNAVDKFLQMPIGRALEWYAFVERASRGKMIYLPVCHQILRDNFLQVELGLSDIYLDEAKYRIVACSDNDGPFYLNLRYEAITLLVDCRQRSEEELEKINIYWKHDRMQKFLNVMNEIKARLFQLTKQEIFLLLGMMYSDFSYNSPIDRSMLEKLVKIDQKIPFLANCEQKFYYKFRKIYSFENVLSFLKNRIKDKYTYKSLIFIIPFVNILASKFVHATFCQKIIDERLVMENAKQALLNKVIQDAGYEELFGYIRPLIKIDECYSWTDIIKMNLPILWHFPLMGYYWYLSYLQKKKDRWRNPFPSIGEDVVFCLVAYGVMFGLSYLGTSLLLILMHTVVCGAILLKSLDDYKSSFGIEKNQAAFCDLPDLLKRTDIVIS